MDGKSAARREAGVRLLKGGLFVRPTGQAGFLWAYPGLRQVQGFYPGEPLRFEYPARPGESLQIADAAFVEALRGRAPASARRRFQSLGFRRTRAWLTLYAGLAALAAGGAAYRWGVPALAGVLSARVPVVWEQNMGQSILAAFVPPGLRARNADLAWALRVIINRLAAARGASPYTFHVTVAEEPVVNAFALPGGEIVVFRGLLEKTRRPEELAGVLAHEMQHVLKRHATRRIIQDSSTAVLLSALAGDPTGGMAYGLRSARALALLQYSREDESEADREGMKLVLAARIDPQGMINFFKALGSEKEPRLIAYLSDHPETQERIKRLKAQAAAAVTRPALPLLPGVDWISLVRKKH